MLISTDWIKEFVNIPNLPAKDIAGRFTLATAEVEDVLTVNEFLENIVVAEILSFERHPEADKLNLVTFKISESDIRKVVCGAANVKVGLKVPFAPLGTKLPNGLLLEAKKIRGVLSEGMLCSEEELGLKDSSEGILELPTDTPVGLSMLKYLSRTKDIILDVDNKSLTHRPDLWGHYGMAREFSAMFNEELKNPFNQEWENKLMKLLNQQASPIIPRFEGESAGISYMGLSVDGIKVTESPDWLKNRLIACGLRSINSIVDISNYVMLELGLPLHIFDRKKISGSEVIIRLNGSESEFTTLDEMKRSLIPSDTIIADINGPLVLAGIMGGLSSGVSEHTENIFIEVANWKAAMVRRTSTRLGLRTDSSQRYEKTLDSQLSLRTMLRTLDLILKLNPNAKVVGKIEYAGVDLKEFKPLQIKSSLSKINTVLGTTLTFDKVTKILTDLDFKVTGDQTNMLVSVPSYRSTKDIEVEADLIEEVGRIIGYDNITSVSPLDGIKPVKLSEVQKVQRKIRDFLVYQSRSFEIMTYPLIGDALLKKVAWINQNPLRLFNALSVDHDTMRTSLIPSLLSVTELNTKHFDRARFFELGRVYNADPKSFSKESLQVGIVFFDRDQSPFVELENTMINLLNSLSLSFDFVDTNPKFPNTHLPTEWLGVHPFEQTNIRVMGKLHGSILSIHPLILSKLKIKGHVSMAIFDLSLFENYSPKDKIKYKPLSKFPTSSFDWTVKVPSQVKVADALNAAKKVKLKELISLEILDIYPSNDENHLTLRATFSDETATLSSEFLKGAESALIDATSKAGFNLK